MAVCVVRVIKTLILFISLSLLLSGCGAPDVEISLPEYIMHAGGETPNGRRESNSIEALNNSYENGEYWLELDFSLTSDSKFVCVHDFYAYYSKDLTGVDVPDLEVFEKLRKSTYGFESPTLDSLILWLDTHPMAVIVTDVKENNLDFARTVAENYPDYIKRFAIQIYGRDEYKTVTALGFDKVIYTLYKQPAERYDVKLIRKFAKKSKNLIALTYAADVENSDSIAEIAKIGVPVYIHTINSAEEQSFWREFGAYGFYTDCIQAK